jgi:hypothetical protein
MTPGGAGLGPCLTAAAPEAAPEVSFASEPLRRCPNAYCGGQRGLLSRWVHADLRETWRLPGLANAYVKGAGVFRCCQDQRTSAAPIDSRLLKIGLAEC